MADHKAKWIAKRGLVDEAGEETKVYLGSPEPARPGEWQCAYRVGKKPASIQYGHGVDAIQALIVALSGIRAGLLRTGHRFEWEGGDGAKDGGFPLFIPHSFGGEFVELMDKRFEEELTKFVAERKPKRGA